MKDQTGRTTQANGLTLVLGATGKTGRRIVEQLVSRGVPTRAASHEAEWCPGYNHGIPWHHQ
jgi:hypothetical protein